MEKQGSAFNEKLQFSSHPIFNVIICHSVGLPSAVDKADDPKTQDDGIVDMT